MSNFDWLELDAKLLQLLVAVVEAGSITGAAHRLGVTQSAVSHLLEKLRLIVNDPLFVKRGRGVVATARAEALAQEAKALLQGLERFARSGRFEPARWQTTFTVAANDLQRDTLVPGLVHRLRTQAPGVVLRVIPSDVPSLAMLRDEMCQLAISPRPPDATDIVQTRLFLDQYRVFFDPTVRAAPSTAADYLAADHVTVVYEPRRALDLDDHLLKAGVKRRFKAMVPGFAGLPALIKGSDMLATAPGLLQRNLMQGLATSTVPFACPPLPMYMIWHQRHQQDEAHRWMRAQISEVASTLVIGGH
jgi:DNA-binding transcriptional LysR family regulator